MWDRIGISKKKRKVLEKDKRGCWGEREEEVDRDMVSWKRK